MKHKRWLKEDGEAVILLRSASYTVGLKLSNAEMYLTFICRVDIDYLSCSRGVLDLFLFQDSLLLMRE